MAIPISGQGLVGTNDIGRREAERVQRSSVASMLSADETNATGQGASPAIQDDELVLSETAMQATDSDAFDQARVDAIRQAISEGNYPLDVRRIAERFQELEDLL
jgi:negative regulator of flagellin synthesis FlgM